MQKELTKLGLTENEAKIYLAVLGLGPSPASSIARHAAIKRPTTYLTLENLIKLGLVSELADSKEKVFKAEEPHTLTKLTKKLRRQAILAETELEKLLPGLKAIQKKLIEAPKVTFYQGVEGIKIIIMEAAEHPEPWYYFGSAQELFKVLSPVDPIDYIISDSREFRHKAGRPVCYTISDPFYSKIKQFQKYEPHIRQTKILPSLAKTKSGFAIFGNKLGLVSVGETSFGTIIESAEIVGLVKIMFNFIWQSLPEEKLKS